LEATKEWLNPCTFDSSKAYCKYCLKHIAASKPFSNKRQQIIPFQSIDICTKEQRKEAQLSLYVAVHTSIASVDHLSDHHKDTPFNISLHRTKCTNIINNVIGPYFYEELVKDIGDGL